MTKARAKLGFVAIYGYVLRRVANRPTALLRGLLPRENRSLRKLPPITDTSKVELSGIF